MSDADLDFLRQLSERQQQRPEPPGGAPRASRGGRGRRRKKSRKGRRLAPFIALAFLLVVVCGGGYVGLTTINGMLNPPDYKGEGSGSVTVWIHEGDSVALMANRLKDAGVVKSVDAFIKLATKDTRATSIQPGYYHLRRQMSVKSALDLLLSDASRAGRLTIPEGKRVTQILPLLASKTHIPLKDFQKAAKHPEKLGLPSYAKGRLEGYLYPFTYDPDPKATATQVLRSMVDQFKKVAANLDLEAKARELGMSPGEVVTIASLVQAESGRPEDMPKVARVIDNRIHSSQPWMRKLQFDSTVMYALGKYNTVATLAETKTQSPYNTYVVSGLPPGPIDNPGEVALKAALEPEKGDWLYFVAPDPKTKITKFTSSYPEFQKLRQELARNTGHG
ncbi:endolytic transglycosylase MltG [Actinoallomurus sp. NPDC052274]|uniref:endolytic transglycosylase MltG n=1 Tax=Actinoallomurus sp. NPDC052274 TaxID=3155420 RepID=UPI003425255B